MTSTSILPRPSDDRAADPSLEELVQRCADGDQDAFEQLYAALAPRVFGLALQVAGEHALAEEIAKDVFTHLWTESGRFDRSGGSATAWALTITHRRAVATVRGAATGRAREGASTPRVDPARSGSIPGRAPGSLDSARVRAALAALTFKQRTAVQLAYFQGLTHAEVATHLGIPHGTAQTRIRDGLRSLAAALDLGATTAT